MKNVTPGPGPGPARTGTTAPVLDARRNQIFILAVFVIVLVLLVRACSGRENRYERAAHELTAAVQRNDFAAVQKLETKETAAGMSHSRFGHAVDAFAPLGKIDSVKEVTPPDDGARVHEFAVKFQNGSVHEKIKFDPDGKIFTFEFAPRQLNAK
jgi:hypothetical protein